MRTPPPPEPASARAEASTPEHYLRRVEPRPVYRHVAVCSCGWESGLCPTPSVALRSHDTHVRQEARRERKAAKA
jgi:hypothetical protein